MVNNSTAAVRDAQPLPALFGVSVITELPDTIAVTFGVVRLDQCRPAFAQRAVIIINFGSIFRAVLSARLLWQAISQAISHDYRVELSWKDVTLTLTPRAARLAHPADPMAGRAVSVAAASATRWCQLFGLDSSNRRG
jgi:hypothetical protein